MFQDKVVIVTGASSGIGKATAIEFAKQGARLVVTGRSRERLEETCRMIESLGREALLVQADIDKEEECQRIIQSAVDHFGQIDVLINNAGISMRALFEEVEIQVLERVMQTNFWGTVYCTKYALPYLLETKGSVVGVLSTAGFRGLPGRTAYSASKFAINGFLECLRTENVYNGLHVLVAAPGFTSSNIRVTALTKDGSEQGSSPRQESKMVSAERVAKRIVKSVRKRRSLLLMTFYGKLIHQFNKFCPVWLDKAIYKHFSREDDSPFK
jgi:dehydrogenase/reductase SDR family protein 7B